MPLPENERIQGIKDLINSTNPVGEKLVPYKGDPKCKLKVYDIPFKFLIFNQFNGRISIDMDSDMAQKPEIEQIYDQELEDKILNYLWELSESSNKNTLRDLESKGQLVPGIITADGVIVDGNRRAMLIKRLSPPHNQYFKAGILEDTYTGGNADAIRLLETQLQWDQDEKVDYEPLSKYNQTRKLIDEHKLTPKDVATMMGQKVKESDVKKWYETFKTMESYLEYIGSPRIWTLLRIGDRKSSKEEGFLEASKMIQQIKNSKVTSTETPIDPKKDSRKYQEMIFDYLRAEVIGSPQQYRLFGLGTANKNGLLHHKELFDQMYERHIINKRSADDLPSSEVYQRENPQMSPKEVALTRENDFKNRVFSDFNATFLEFTGKAQSNVQEKRPETRIADILSNINLVNRDNDLDMLKNSENLNDTISPQLKEIQTALNNIKKVLGV